MGSQVFGGVSKQTKKYCYISGGARRQQTATSTSVNQMFALIMLLTKTHSDSVEKK
jgi:hypothetical protein